MQYAVCMLFWPYCNIISCVSLSHCCHAARCLCDDFGVLRAKWSTELCEVSRVDRPYRYELVAVRYKGVEQGCRALSECFSVLECRAIYLLLSAMVKSRCLFSGL
ncbi:hypothetical protein BZA70DRAFT_270698 [Myxozyma melibiosi]|uniref:Secreted protein n=1 Tax=Myxozyma melibiosi TaxID=54550 RepID=A0ABR1FBH3_9ASCO